MRILEPEDGGVESQRVRITSKNKLLSTKLESSNKLKHKNINRLVFPLWQRADKIYNEYDRKNKCFRKRSDIHFREVIAQFDRPVLLFSGGKDSITLSFSSKAFFPSKILSIITWIPVITFLKQLNLEIDW
jgi:hypothetical protein